MKQFQYFTIYNPSKFFLPLSLVLCLSLAQSANADDTYSMELGNEDGKTVQDDVDSPSLMRQYMWTGSLDRAGDATRNAEIDLKNLDIDCSKIKENYESSSDPKLANYLRYCEHMKQKSPELGQQAESVRRQQRILADVSRVSDLAAVGAVGTMLYTEMGMKDSNQSASLAKVARIQKKAGYVNYVAGATDVAIGAYAYVGQAKKLESIKQELTGKGKLYSASGSGVISSLNTAIEKSKSAAYSHMLFGAGKMAAGYATMYMSKQNQKQADNMATFEEQMLANKMNQPYPMPTISQAPVNGGAPYYQNNQPSFSIAGASSSDGTGSTAGNGFDMYSASAASLMPQNGISRNPASKGTGVSEGTGGSLSMNASGTETGEDAEAAAEAAASDKNAEALGSFEFNLSSGGGSRYTGGGDSSSGKQDTPSAGTGFADSVGTGVNPNEVYKSALESPNQAAADKAVGEGSLFDAIRAKHMQMVEMGRLMGPPPVEVKTN
ncbi:MAG: hypothetical protein M9962_03190 [Oligoflexia bacterium]|nr:hypothetical protein [Oligoflexia bacterium]